MGFPARAAFVLIASVSGFCQLPSVRCDSIQSSLQDCPFVTLQDTAPDIGVSGGDAHADLLASDSETPMPNGAAGSAFVSAPALARLERFHWGRALLESFMFFSISQAYVVHDDYHWVVVENGVPFNHYWRDYKQSLSSWIHAGWDDGDPKLYSYVGHPIQGALTGYIQVQNDPKGRALEFENSKVYWHSRLRALIWNTVYSTQWTLGPLSELTFEKYGTQARPSWNQDGSWPCTRKPCANGTGQVDLVITPAGGFAWMLAEDLLDKKVARRLEGSTRNHFLIDTARCALNPIRGGANILHGKSPWYRASRDASQVYWSRHAPDIAGASVGH